MKSATLCLLLLACAEALLVPSRLAGSRVAPGAACQAALPIYMCDAAEATEAAPEPVAEAEEPAAAAEAAEAPAPRRSKGPKTPIEEIEVGSTLEGTIRSVQSYGAFVDLGASTDGLLHVSEMSDDFVKDANDLFKVGDSVSVRVKGVNIEKGQVALSCKSEDAPRRGGGRRERPDLSEYEGADDKVFITGKVNSITSYGAFVTLKEGVDGLVHISAIQEGGVGKVEDVLSEGQEVQVRVVSFDKSKRRIGLSMKPWTEQSEEEKKSPRGRRGGRGRDDEDDSIYQMTAEELEDQLSITVESVGIEVLSPFDAALARADEKKAAKASGKRYADTASL